MVRQGSRPTQGSQDFVSILVVVYALAGCDVGLSLTHVLTFVSFCQQRSGMFFAMPALICHLIMASRIAMRNPVNQDFFIFVQYFAMIAESLLLAVNGIWYASEGNHAKHMVRMYYTWIQSVVGSGTIRFTAWILWLIGKFFSLETRMLIDRGACQAMAIHGYEPWGWEPTQVGSAEHCFKAVFLNLAFTDMLTIWLEWVFLCVPIARWDKADRASIAAKFKMICLLSVIYIAMVFVFNTPSWLIKVILGAWAFFVKMGTFRFYISELLGDPNEGKPTAESSYYDYAYYYGKRGALNLFLLDEPDDISDDEDAHAHND